MCSATKSPRHETSIADERLERPGILLLNLKRLLPLYLGAAIVLPCMAMMALVTYSYSLYLILFFLFGTGAATSWTSLNTMAVEISTEFRKPVTSVYNAIKFAGYAFSPVILSLIYAPFQLKAVQMGCMGAVIISSFLAFRAEPR